jgi:hypothetical protein
MSNRIVKRLSPTIEVMTPLGLADAEFLIECGDEAHIQWVCWIRKTGECWTFVNPEIRKSLNMTMQRDTISPFSESIMNRYKGFNHG